MSDELKLHTPTEVTGNSTNPLCDEGKESVDCERCLGTGLTYEVVHFHTYSDTVSAGEVCADCWGKKKVRRQDSSQT